jgi:hypothetical protein|tara:strand:+ start:1791 stop:1979 length:189 start_codon:yes stop_codon:yes gene_type:complete
MAGIKARGVITNHMKRYHKEKEIVPCKYIADGKGKGIMVAQYKESRDLVVDDLGKPIPWGMA